MRLWEEKHLPSFKQRSKTIKSDRKQEIDCEDLVPRDGWRGGNRLWEVVALLFEVSRASSQEGKADRSPEQGQRESELNHKDLWVPSCNDASDILQKLMPCAAELIVLQAQDLGDLGEES